MLNSREMEMSQFHFSLNSSIPKIKKGQSVIYNKQRWKVARFFNDILGVRVWLTRKNKKAVCQVSDLN